MQVVEILLITGPSIPNVNLTNGDKETALHCASQYGHIEVCVFTYILSFLSPQSSFSHSLNILSLPLYLFLNIYLSLVFKMLFFSRLTFQFFR